MTDVIDGLIDRVLKREGFDRFTNDAADAGGPTKYGITLATLYAWRGRPVGAHDVEQLGEAEARQIYRANYFPAGFEKIPEPALLEELFDFGVNSGPGAAVKALQTVLKEKCGYYAGVIDGGFGPQSHAALARVQNWTALFFAVKCERLELYLRSIGARPANARFAIGWANRADTIDMKLAAAEGAPASQAAA
jgi:lysozyme family protein